jgi:pimeloyl-ACP methyl ester carboxylesterase
VTDTASALPEGASERLELGGGSIHVQRGGEGPPLLFLHAAGGAGAWHPFLGLLARRFDVVAPDHPGFGGSDDMPEVEAMDDLVYHYLDVLDRLGLERVNVVGGSLGGWLAAELAVHSPERVERLVLLGAVGIRVPGNMATDIFLMMPDQVVPIEHGRIYAERIPDATLQIVEDCGHAMYFERPEAFADAVTEFLEAGS